MTKMAWAMGYEHGLKGMRRLVHRDGRKYPKDQENFRYNAGYRAGEARRQQRMIEQHTTKEQSND